MEVQDFYNLKTTQQIYYLGEKYTVLQRFFNSEDSPMVTLDAIGEGRSLTRIWRDICQDCSLEKPKEKITRRYWQWKIKTSDIYGWERFDKYLDDNGHCSVHQEGDPEIFDWGNISKIKIEDDFVDVEVEQ